MVDGESRGIALVGSLSTVLGLIVASVGGQQWLTRKRSVMVPFCDAIAAVPVLSDVVEVKIEVKTRTQSLSHPFGRLWTIDQ